MFIKFIGGNGRPIAINENLIKRLDKVFTADGTTEDTLTIVTLLEADKVTIRHAFTEVTELLNANDRRKNAWNAVVV